MTTPALISIDPVVFETHAIISPRKEVWRQIGPSLERLAALRRENKPYPEMVSDRDAILTYADILTRSLDAMAASICLAEYLGRVSDGPSPQERFLAGLRALSEGLELQFLSEPSQRRAELVRCFHALLGTSASLPATASPPSQTNLEQWKQALDKLTEQIHSLERPVPTEAERNAWVHWRNRLLAHISNASEVPPDLNYLVCRVLGSSAGKVLPSSPKRMTLSQWSQTLVASLAKGAETPLWFVVALIRALGFDTYSLDRAFAGHSTTEIHAAMEFFSTAAPAQTQKGLLVIRAPIGSVTETWPLTSDVPTILLTAEEYYGPRRLDVMWFFVPRFHGVLIEVEASEKPADALSRVDAERLFATLRQAIGGPVRTALLFRSTPPPDAVAGLLGTSGINPSEAVRVFLAP